MRAAAWGLVLVLLASACTDGDEVTAPVANPEATRGGTIVVGITQPGSIEPTNAYESQGSLVVSTICDPLIQLQPETGELQPAIARSWQISDSGRRITLRLRRDVRFHNGEELTAEDVAYSLSRVASDESASLVADLMKPVVGYEQVHGDDDEIENEADRQQLRGVRIIENYSLEILLKDSMSDFIRVLTHPATSPIPKESTIRDPLSFAARPVCAGPYQMTGPWTPGDPSIRVQKFDGYYANNAAFSGGGGGYADFIEFRVLPDRDAEIREFTGGMLDIAHVAPSRVPDVINLGDALVSSPGSVLEYIGLPRTIKPFDSLPVRIALSRALDRQAISSDVYRGSRRPAGGFYPPSLGKVHREGAGACGRNAPLDGDVAGAQNSLTESGVGLAGSRIKLRYNDEFDNASMAEAVARRWQEVLGVEVETEGVPWDQYITQGRSQSGFDSAFRMSWGPSYPGPDAFIAPLFSSDAIGSDNLARFRDANFDRQLSRVARRTPNESDLRVAYQDLEDLVCEQMPVIPIAFTHRHRLVAQARIGSATGVWLDLASGEPALREIFVRD